MDSTNIQIATIIGSVIVSGIGIVTALIKVIDTRLAAFEERLAKSGKLCSKHLSVMQSCEKTIFETVKLVREIHNDTEDLSKIHEHKDSNGTPMVYKSRRVEDAIESIMKNMQSILVAQEQILHVIEWLRSVNKKTGK